jgi:hypothetical protein
MRYIVLLLLGLFVSSPCVAQQTTNSLVVTTCGTPPFTYPAGQVQPSLQDVNGERCVNTTGGSIVTNPVAVTSTDRGGTLTAGGTAQNAAAANSSRKLFVIQNPCTAAGQNIATAEDLFVAVTGAATVNGAGNFADLPPCGSATLTVNGTAITAAVSVNATTISHRWSATEGQ